MSRTETPSGSPERDAVSPLAELDVLNLDSHQLIGAINSLYQKSDENRLFTRGECAAYRLLRLSGTRGDFFFALLELKHRDKGELTDPAERAYYDVFKQTGDYRAADLAAKAVKSGPGPKEARGQIRQTLK